MPKSDEGSPRTRKRRDLGDSREADVFEVEEGDESEVDSRRESTTPRESQDGKRRPAYVAPIGKIPDIPSIERVASPDRGDIPTDGRPEFARPVMESLVGKTIDEYGDIVDKNGKDLGRAAGDLPSMVGRSVQNHRGDITGDDGELLGYVAEVEGAEPINQPGPQTQSLDEYMGGSGGAFRVDDEGNILDSQGNIVGSFHDNNKSGPKPARKEKPPKPAAQEEEETRQQRGPSEERPNAQSYRKENDSPSDIFLDVKSTTEGIQLTIRIPTVFPGGGQPRVNIS